MESEIYIVGAGAHAREIAEFLGLNMEISVKFLVEEKYLSTATEPSRTTSISSYLANRSGQPLILGVGAPGLKRKLEKLVAGNNYTQVLAHGAYLGKNNSLGVGVVIAPGVIITTGVTLGRHVSVNVGATISHDCAIGDYATIAPGANIGGNVKIDAGSFIGIGATIKQGVHIAEGVVVGAGAVVVKDIDKKNAVVVGNPARMMKINGDWLDEI